jgi:hypothetical protein
MCERFYAGWYDRGFPGGEQAVAFVHSRFELVSECRRPVLESRHGNGHR